MWRLTVAFIVIGIFMAACSDGSDERPSQPTKVLNTPIALADGTITLTGWPLRTSNRSHVSVCVEGALGFEPTEEHRQTVQRALDDILGNIPDPVAGHEEWDVVQGCPPAPNLYLRGRDVSLSGLGPKVTKPDEHLVFVYFLPEDSEYRLPVNLSRIQTTEVSCVNRRCHKVTSGVYALASSDSEGIRRSLLSALRFAPVDFGNEDRYLLTEDRMKLSVCIDRPSGGRISKEEFAVFSDGFERALGSLPAIPGPFLDYELTVGCPDPTVEIGAEYRFDNISNFTETPNKHLIFVYLLDGPAYQATFGGFGESFALTTEERKCDGHTCDSLSLGLYTSESTSTPEDWRYPIARSINVVLAEPRSDPEFYRSPCDGGEKPHPFFSCEPVERYREDDPSLGIQVY